MLSQLFVFHKSKNFTSDNWIRIPPTVPINHYLGVLTNKIDQGLILLFHANVFNGISLLWTLYFAHSKWRGSYTHQLNDRYNILIDGSVPQVQTPRGWPSPRTRNSTTSFLTATTLVYAIGAGITAAAGTRLALQLILDKGFKLFSFQLSDFEKPNIVIYCHYLPVSGLGNLRACCLPWMW